MEFTKDIYFSDSLKNGQTTKITYVGELYSKGSQNVNLVCGFGENWDYTSTIPMEKTENGFVAEIEIKDYDTFNFCFSDENNCWDNNNYFNYVSPILPKPENFNFEFEFDSLEELVNPKNEITNDICNETKLDETIEFGNDYSSSIDDIIEDILGNTVQNSISNSEENVDILLDSLPQENTPEIEALFNELFFEEPTAIETENFDNNDNIIATNESDNSELIKLFDELFNNNDKPITFEEETPAAINASSFNLDGLVSELLDPVINIQDTNAEESLFDNIEGNTITEETALIPLQNELQVSSRRLSTFYKMKKRISIACYKLFVKLPKDLAKQLGFYFN